MAEGATGIAAELTARRGGRLSELRLSAVVMGLLAALVGFGSSFAVILAGLRGVGASAPEAASGLAAATLAMGLAGMALSLSTRLPMAVAWSTPGGALLAVGVAPAGGFPEAVGAFLVSAVLLSLTAFVRPLARLVAAIPMPVASAMLAGILLPLTLAPVKAVATDWRLGLPIVLAWLLAGQWHRLLAVPAALAVFAVVTVLGTDLPDGTAARLLGSIGLPLVFQAPAFTLESTFGIALPLYVVTMASQNIPGLAVLRAHGVEPAVGRGFGITGIASLASAPFGSPAINLAAITAAMCAGPEAGEDPSKRYWAAAVSGMAYVAFAFIAGAAALFVSIAPAILIEAVAGLALIAAFSAAIVGAFSDERSREAAAIAFLVSAGGLTIAGVSGAFWGLLAGIAVHALRAGLPARLTRASGEATSARPGGPSGGRPR